mgnify:CR=1 FL=1
MSLDIKKIRNDFPILKRRINSHQLVYFDNAATSQKPSCVIDSISRYYENINANVHRGVHTLSQQATDDYEAARQACQQFINAEKASEIIYCRGTTEAINLVAQTYGRSHLKRGDEIVITALEHHSNIVPWQILCQQNGAVLKVAPINKKGEVLIDAYEKLLSDKTKLVAFNHISNALGTINPVKQMTAMAHKVNAKVLIDGAQSLPHGLVDVQDIDCDFYTASGHKLFAPTGIGFLYGKAELLAAMPPYQGGGEMIQQVTFEKSTYAPIPHKFEAGTPNIAGAIGLGAAIKYLNHIGRGSITAYEQELLQYATQQAEAMPGLQIIGTATDKASILSFVLQGIHAHDIGTILDHHGIAVRTGHHCAMPVMQFFDVPATVRASFSFYNTKAEIDRLFIGLKIVQDMFNNG